MSIERIDATQNRKNFYQNYRKIEHDWIPPGTFKTYTKIKPGFQTLLLTAIMITSAVMAEKKQDELTTEKDDDSDKDVSHSFQFFKPLKNEQRLSLAELAAANMEIDANLKDNRNECSNIPKKIAELGKILPGASERIIRVLFDNKIKIMCTSNEYLKVHSLETESFSGIYVVDEKILYLFYNKLHLSSINHEFIHADNALSHSKLNQYRAFPLQSQTKESIDSYEAALNKCIQRIEEFNTLREKKRKKIRLTGKEFQQLKIYHEAAKDCIIRRQGQISLNQDGYERLIQSGWNSENPNARINMGGVFLKVLNIKASGKNRVMIVEPATSEDSILFSVFEINGSNFKEFYVQQAAVEGTISPLHQKIKLLTEQDARLRETLSQNAENVFLKEANELIIQDKASDDNQYKRKLEL